MINISQFTKAQVLMALYNASKQQGMGFLNMSGQQNMTESDAQMYINSLPEASKHSFDYVRGRVIKCDIDGDEFNPWLFDRDNGDGAAARAIATLTPKTSTEPSSSSTNGFTVLLLVAAALLLGGCGVARTPVGDAQAERNLLDAAAHSPATLVVERDPRTLRQEPTPSRIR